MAETSEQRSRTMRAVRSLNTGPEKTVRGLLRNLGFKGYRIHRRDLAGSPDIAFIGLKRAIFVHGCFWHGHSCPRGRRIPRTNTDYWRKKIEHNRQRDNKNLVDLAERGWVSLVVWECEIPDEELSARLKNFLTCGLDDG